MGEPDVIAHADGSATGKQSPAAQPILNRLLAGLMGYWFYVPLEWFYVPPERYEMPDGATPAADDRSATRTHDAGGGCSPTVPG